MKFLFVFLALTGVILGAEYCPKSPTKETCAPKGTAGFNEKTMTKECTFSDKKMLCVPLTKEPEKSTTPPSSCTFEKIQTCIKSGSTSTATACADGVRPKYDLTTCCPDCKKTVTEKKVCAVAATCEGDNKPAYKDGCLTCKIALKACTKDKLTACKTKENKGEIATCIVGEKPIRDKECCPSCVPKLNACGRKKASGNVDGLTTSCKADTLKALSKCEKGKFPTFNTDTCCPSCKPIAPEKPKKDGKVVTCAKADIKKCKDSIQVCEIGEKPEKIDDSCCRTCVPARWLCKASDRAKDCNFKNLPDCDANAQPEFAEGSCCPSCRKPKPACSPACKDTEICAKAKGDDEVTSCVDKVDTKVKLKFDKAPTADEASEETMTELVRDLIEKYCDNEDDATIVDKCSKYKTTATDNLVVKVESRKDKDVELTVKIPKSSQVKASRRLLGDEEIVTSAVGNADSSTDGVSGSASAPTNSFSASSTLAISAASLLLPVVAMIV